jgi:hypothetical protein
VEASRLGDRARSKLIRLLSDDHPEPVRWLGQLRSLSELENTPVFASAVRFLFHLNVEDAEAQAVRGDSGFFVSAPLVCRPLRASDRIVGVLYQLGQGVPKDAASAFAIP